MNRRSGVGFWKNGMSGMLNFVGKRENGCVGSSDRTSRAATSNYVEEARRLSKVAIPRLSSESRKCFAVARDESRSRDDDHVGTEHVVLALWAIGPNRAVEALDKVGISRDLFCEQLLDEPGPSPEGVIYAGSAHDHRACRC